MLRYLLKRILLFLPTLLFISLLTFGLSKVAPGDPVESVNKTAENDGTYLKDRERVYSETARLLGLDKPVFYFSLSAVAYPDTLYRILSKDRRKAMRHLIAQYGNWTQIAAYQSSVQSLEYFLYELPDTLHFENLSRLRSNTRQLYFQYKDNRIAGTIDTLIRLTEQDSALAQLSIQQIQGIKNSYENVKAGATRWKLYIPDLKWYGWDNQYHNWARKFLQGDFGISYIDGRPVANKMNDALFWTLIMNGLAIFFAYALSIPLGVFSAVHKNSWQDRFITVLLFLLHSLPVFWIATLLLIFFTTPEYGMYIFPNPARGMGDLPDQPSFWDILAERVPRLILPVFCLTYSSLAFISRQMRGGMLDVLKQDYIRTARAKGLDEQKVVWKHAFRNALFPIITLFASVFPAALAGSVVIEMIFNIPGMGQLTVEAIRTNDFPVVYTVLMLSSVLIMIGLLISDILYGLLDPRVSYSQQK